MFSRSCVSYIKYNYSGSLRRALDSEISKDPVSRKRKLKEEVEAWEENRKGEGRNPKRARNLVG